MLATYANRGAETHDRQGHRCDSTSSAMLITGTSTVSWWPARSARIVWAVARGLSP
jgi:hypothetical protein